MANTNNKAKAKGFPEKPADTYLSITYDVKERFISYWHQIDEIISLNPERILEIGTGNGFVRGYLRKKGYNCNSLDIMRELKPDIQGSVLELPFADETFDAILCCEVLEHLPYSDFKGALAEIYRTAKTCAVLSLPDVTTVYRINIELPRMKPIKALIPHPFHRPTPHKYDGEHYWEIGKTEYLLARIEQDILQSGFSVINTYRVFEFYYHRFFLLKKRSRQHGIEGGKREKTSC